MAGNLSGAVPMGTQKSINRGVELLAEGNYGDFSEPFIAVIREGTAYSQLRQIVSGLPERDDASFYHSAVIAAFCGQRRTGGFRIDIGVDSGGAIQVEELGPPKDALVTEAITSPFKVISVPLSGQEAQLKLKPGRTWADAGTPFEVTKGEFTISGGFAGRTETFPLEGRVRVLRLGKLISLVFELRGQKPAKLRELNTIATGSIDAGGKVTLPQFDAGSLISPPPPPLSATGTISQDGKRLALVFQSIASEVIADGYVGQGTLEANGAGAK
jgi:hypothetical protein